MKNNRSGFTLIELAIVITIIGLVIGGALAGRELMTTGAIRSQIAQIETMQAAIGSFKEKYKYLPGDVPSTTASQMGLTARSGAAGHGDGNGQIQQCAAPWTTLTAGCENILVWSDLENARLTEGGFNAITDTTATMTASQVKNYYPFAKIGNNASLLAFHYPLGGAVLRPTNVFAITKVMSVTAGAYSLANTMPPSSAFAIDQKIDDGLSGGKVVPITVSTGNFNTFSQTGCTNAGTNATYVLTSNAVACSLLVSFTAR